MKKILWILILIVVPVFHIIAQTLTENEITGTWSVKQINVLTRLPDEQKKSIEILKAAFLRSKFIFNADYSFVFDFELDKMRIQNGHWKYNGQKKSLIIQDWKDRDTNNCSNFDRPDCLRTYLFSMDGNVCLGNCRQKGI